MNQCAAKRQNNRLCQVINSNEHNEALLDHWTAFLKATKRASHLYLERLNSANDAILGLLAKIQSLIFKESKAPPEDPDEDDLFANDDDFDLDNMNVTHQEHTEDVDMQEDGEQEKALGILLKKAVLALAFGMPLNLAFLNELAAKIADSDILTPEDICKCIFLGLE